ncbi:MAG: zinc-ribbon domain containing protein [Chloroflexi bacterium]|nr:zinc-ribbon domain containing protein [Chloroflexota bacterium]
MGFQDKSLECSDCGSTFTFTAKEQELFASRGYTNEPKRCPNCRAARKSERYASGGSTGTSGGGMGGFRPQRQMFPAKCSACGADTKVPFEPRGDRPVYCSECYNRVKMGR